MDGNSRLPRTGTVSFHLLELTAICGELPTDLLPRIPGSTSYKESVITSLKKDGLLKTYYRDKLRGYRLSRRARSFLLEENPERFSFFLTGNGETSRLKSEFPRRLRLHRVAEIFVSMQNAGIRIFRDEKPEIFSAGGPPVPMLDCPAYYSSREIKEIGIDAVKIRGSRMAGALLTSSGIFVIYNGDSYTMKWDYRAEIKVQVFLKLLLCCERLPGQYARTEVSGLLLGNGLEHFYQILSAADTASRCFFLLDGNYEHFYYLTNDQYGDTLLKLLCSSEKITELNRMLMQGLSPKDTGLPIEHDALDGDGSPVLFGYFLDIPRINRFHTALQLQERTGTLICFDFQKEVLHRFCGGQAEFSTISFEKFERRFFP